MSSALAKGPGAGSFMPDDTASIKQLYDTERVDYSAVGTNNLWVSPDKALSIPRAGNAVLPLTTGKMYFENLIATIKKAERVIYIGDWQINWDALLQKGKRLFDILLDAVTAQPALKVYVMAWKHSAPVNTYDTQTDEVLSLINKKVGRTCIFFVHAPSLADEDASFFSHHQKFVVVDEKIAFVGGMDLCYGRFDDETYNLRADAEGRVGLNRYNGCVAKVGTVDETKTPFVDPDLLSGMVDTTGWFGHTSNETDTFNKIEKGAFQFNYTDEYAPGSLVPHFTGKGVSIDKSTLDPNVQPRMPWQDVHVRIEGPSATDVARNFVMRWNSEGGEKTKLRFPPKPAEQTGGCTVQVLRSAPKKMREAEYKGLDPADQATVKQPTSEESSIAMAMQNLIRKANHFIYIENQFFVSGFVSEYVDPTQPGPNVAAPDNSTGPAAVIRGKGVSEYGTRLVSNRSTEAPKNFICEELGNRIGRAILSAETEPFHVYITLPVRPEGKLDDASVMTQIHWTMQSISFGSYSLLNRIRRYLKARLLRDAKDETWKEVLHNVNDRRYETVSFENCREYVTLLNLRNWENLDGRYVTEQIYGHTKTMIVDDLFALVGSANINDRSMLGTRDSEIAVLVCDSEVDRIDIDGSSDVKVIRKFARKLRQQIWKKIFGITGNVRPAHSLIGAVEQPANPKSWKEIQDVADFNSRTYEAAFDYIPRNFVHKVSLTSSDSGQKEPASIWPTWVDKRSTLENVKMPFNANFWKVAQQTNKGAAEALSKITGFIVSLPIYWTAGENNNLGFAVSLVAENDRSNNNIRPDTEMAEQSSPVANNMSTS